MVLSTKNRLTDHFYEAFIDINYTLYTLCWTRTILGSSYKTSHASHQEISAKFACDMRFSPIHKMQREKIRYKRSKSFLRDFEAIMKIHVPLQLENKMKNLLDQMKLILALSKWQKNVLKMTTKKSKTPPFTKICSTHASLCCDHR